jgi:hypothetical protein
LRPNPAQRPRVVKRLDPTQPGAIKLARRYGEALVCVRYRHDADGRDRITTVELVVNRTPIVRRPSPTVAVELRFEDRVVRARALALGATWDWEARVWYMSREVARKLGVLKRIVRQGVGIEKVE